MHHHCQDGAEHNRRQNQMRARRKVFALVGPEAVQHDRCRFRNSSSSSIRPTRGQIEFERDQQDKRASPTRRSAYDHRCGGHGVSAGRSAPERGKMPSGIPADGEIIAIADNSIVAGNRVKNSFRQAMADKRGAKSPCRPVEIVEELFPDRLVEPEFAAKLRQSFRRCHARRPDFTVAWYQAWRKSQSYQSNESRDGQRDAFEREFQHGRSRSCSVVLKF